MNKLHISFLFLVLVLFTGCNNNDDLKDKSELITMWVSAQTTLTYDWEDIHQDNPIRTSRLGSSG